MGQTPSKKVDGPVGLDPRLAHADDVAQAQFEQRYGELKLLAEDVQGAQGEVYGARVRRGVHMGARVIAKRIMQEEQCSLDAEDIANLRKFFDEAGQYGRALTARFPLPGYSTKPHARKLPLRRGQEWGRGRARVV